MVADKYSAVWVSYSSISDFLRCPRSYYLKNMYRNPDTGHKAKLVSPPLSLGQIVHEVIESLSVLPTDQRFSKSLVGEFDRLWTKVSGKHGGFVEDSVEQQYKQRGERMMEKIMKNPGPLKNLAVKIQTELPYFWLSEKDQIILCGKIDWLEYIKESDSVHIIDFKTSKSDEDPKSIQLWIYYLLASRCQKRKVSRISYWYIERNDKPVEQSMPDSDDAGQKILDYAKQIKLARQLNRFKCPHTNGCTYCKPFEAVLRGEATFVGTNGYNEDLYLLDRSFKDSGDRSIVL